MFCHLTAHPSQQLPHAHIMGTPASSATSLPSAPDPMDGTKSCHHPHWKDDGGKEPEPGSTVTSDHALKCHIGTFPALCTITTCWCKLFHPKGISEIWSNVIRGITETWFPFQTLVRMFSAVVFALRLHLSHHLSDDHTQLSGSHFQRSVVRIKAGWLHSGSSWALLILVERGHILVSLLPTSMEMLIG